MADKDASPESKNVLTAHRKRGEKRLRLKKSKTIIASDVSDSQNGRFRLFDSLRGMIAEEEAFGRSFLVAPVILSLGAVWWFHLRQAPSMAGLSVYGLLALTLAFWLRYRARPVSVICWIGFLFICGAFLSGVETDRKATVMLDMPVVTHVTGLVEAREKTTSGWRYVVQLRQTSDPEIRRPPERVTLVARGKDNPVEIGKGITGLAGLSPPSGPALPGLTDFGFLSYFDGIGAVGFFYGPPKPADQVRLSASGAWMETASDGVAARIERLRGRIAENITTVLPGESGAFANAIITGQRRAMSDDALEALRNAGLAHVIAISGLHMALAAGIFYAGLRLLFSLSARFAEGFAVKKMAAIAAIAAAFAYLLISGMQVSARRAFIMLAIMMVAVVFDRPALSLRNVAIAALLILATTPSEIVGPGMQMSFAATLALIAGYGLWQSRHTAEPGQGRAAAALSKIVAIFATILFTALIGGLSTAPFAIEHFQRMSAYGLLGNLLAMPIVTFIVMPAGLMAMLTMPLGLHGPFLYCMGVGLDWVLAAAHWVDSLGGALVTGQTPALFLPLFVAGFLPLVLLKTRLRLVGILPIFLALALPFLPQKAEGARLLIDEDGKLLALVDQRRAATNLSRPSAFIYEQWQSALRLDETIAPVDHERPQGEAVFFNPDDRYARLSDENIALADAAMRASLQQAIRAPDIFHCRKNMWCLASLFGGRVTVIQVLAPAFAGIACDQADIVVSRYRTGFQSCRSGSLLITPELRRQTGTLVMMREDKPTHSLSRIPRPDERPDERPAITVPADNALKVSVPGCTVLSLVPSIATLDRSWNRHRLYDWRAREFARPLILPKQIAVSDSGESGRQACPEP